jgi:GNAT superfamily N-acetyltransferase
LSKNTVVRRALSSDAPAVDSLLFEWLNFKPSSGRLDSIHRAISNKELLVATVDSRVIGFIHYVMHEDVIDGNPNSFITAFYVAKLYRRRGLGTLLLKHAITDSISNGAVGVETSTTHVQARRLYERLHFKQTTGDIGEVFLELDLEEYLHAENSRRSSADDPDRNMNQLE